MPGAGEQETGEERAQGAKEPTNEGEPRTRITPQASEPARKREGADSMIPTNHERV